MSARYSKCQGAISDNTYLSQHISLLNGLGPQYLSKNKVVFQQFSVEKKLNFIENAIQKDIKFRNSLKGMVIGLFTLEEYNRYITNSSALNKRMMNLIIERIKSQVQLIANS